MSVKKSRYRRKNAEGLYDTYHFETEVDQVNGLDDYMLEKMKKIAEHNADATAHKNGIAGNAATATRLKPTLNGSRNQCWLLCKLPKNSYALVHYKVLGAQYYDQYSVLEVVIKNGTGWCKYTGFSTNYQVSVKAYETDNSIDVYLFAQNYDDIWEVFLKKNNAVTEFAYKKMGAATYVPAGTLVCDTSSGQGMGGVELFNAKSSTGESVGHIGFTISNIPEGCLTLDTGALVSRATYPELWAFVQSNRNLLPVMTDSEWQTMAGNQTSVAAFSMGDGSTTFRLPKLLDYPRGGTVGDVGTWYGDAIRNLTGTVTCNGGGSFASGNGIISVSDKGANIAPGPAQSTHYDDFIINASKQVPTAAENRPKTIVSIFYIRAFHGTTNQGIIDITALANEKADVNLSNINAVGKKIIAKLWLPSDTFETIMPPVSGGEWIAPSNGYLSYYCKSQNPGAVFQISNTANRMIDRRCGANTGVASLLDLAGFMPVRKNDVIVFSYLGVMISGCYFIYAEGEI